jgi:hypothetical protein
MNYMGWCQYEFYAFLSLLAVILVVPGTLRSAPEYMLQDTPSTGSRVFDDDTTSPMYNSGILRSTCAVAALLSAPAGRGNKGNLFSSGEDHRGWWASKCQTVRR